ncbi:hypothetical protein C8Q76DRAFT_578319, partial [Earliella scabrosa]
AVSPAASTTLLSAGSASPRTSVYDPAFVRRSSIVRPQSPTMLGALPGPAIQMRHEPTIPEGALPPTTPGLSRLGAGVGWLHASPDMPSPALTEGSSTHAPDGLLDPRLSLLGQHGMQSTGAISFQDDRDYSRPIGGLVNNRQYSRTTIQTVSS